MGKLHVGIICGGRSAEHEVSLQSAKNILAALDRQRFIAHVIGIDKQGRWYGCDEADFLHAADDPTQIALKLSTAAAEPFSLLAPLDVVFPIVHGTLGEDGSLQGVLRMAGLPFVGAGVMGSAIAMDKDVAKRLLQQAGLPVAPFVCLRRGDVADYQALSAQLGTILFIKPANQGSSVGVSKVRNATEFACALELAFAFDHKIMIESAIVGREIECAVLGNTDPQASVCGEVVVFDEFYAYDTKYIAANGAQTVIPAEIASDIQQRIQQLALRAFAVLECTGMARVDVFLTKDNQIIINEINTLPGFTQISMYPKLWQASGLDYSHLISRLLELALEKQQSDQQLRISMAA